MSKLELAKEKIKEFYPKVLVEVLDVADPYDKDVKFDENEIISDKFIGEYATKSFEVNYGENEDIINIVAKTEDAISLNALVMFMCINIHYAISPLNTDKYYISRFRVTNYLHKIYSKTTDNRLAISLVDFSQMIEEENIDE